MVETDCPLVYIVVVTLTRSRREDTLECLQSVFRMTYPTVFVVLVDNASTDGTRETITARFPRMARADVCLGAFGVTCQSLITIHNKIYEGFATSRQVPTGDLPPVRKAFVHGEHLYLCVRAGPLALAEAVRAQARCTAAQAAGRKRATAILQAVRSRAHG